MLAGAHRPVDRGAREAREGAASSRWAREGSQIYAERRDHRDSVRRSRDAIVDPTGCGDAFRAGLLYGIASGSTGRRRAGSRRCWARSRSRSAAGRTITLRATRSRSVIRKASIHEFVTGRFDQVVSRSTRVAASRRARSCGRRCSSAALLLSVAERGAPQARDRAVVGASVRVLGVRISLHGKPPTSRPASAHDRGKPRLVARHLRDQRGRPGALRREVGGPAAGR